MHISDHRVPHREKNLLWEDTKLIVRYRNFINSRYESSNTHIMNIFLCAPDIHNFMIGRNHRIL